jgi:hypothetical protein
MIANTTSICPISSLVGVISRSTAGGAPALQGEASARGPSRRYRRFSAKQVSLANLVRRIAGIVQMSDPHLRHLALLIRRKAAATDFDAE